MRAASLSIALTSNIPVIKYCPNGRSKELSDWKQSRIHRFKFTKESSSDIFKSVQIWQNYGRESMAHFLADPIYTKFEVCTCTRYDAMNGGAKCGKLGGLGWLGGIKGHGRCQRSIESARDFLFNFDRNYAAILYLFSRCSECQQPPILSYPTCTWRPRWGWPRWNFAMMFGTRKPSPYSLGYRVLLFAWSYVDQDVESSREVE